MTTASNLNPESHAAFNRVAAEDRRPALSLLLTGRRGAEDSAVAPFEAFARENQLDLQHLWTASDGKRPVVAVLIVPGVGRTAMLFLSPLASAAAGKIELAGRLIAHALAHLNPDKIRLAQALLDQGQPTQRRAIEAGGFRFLADLAYMHRAGKAVAELPPIGLDGETLGATHWSEAARPLFTRAIADSYRGTLDCPGLLGLRDMDDIIAGHMATGRFNPKHWIVWHQGDTPAAVLLLAESAAARGFELVYLGVCPHARRRGLSRDIMQHALHITATGGTHASGNTPLQLAVDDRNKPALRLYRGLGFRTSVRKTALIYTPPGPPAPPADT
ncbi:MAG: GNAT family N-acetyltransferase [Planctomycetota bacterium]